MLQRPFLDTDSSEMTTIVWPFLAMEIVVPTQRSSNRLTALPRVV